MESPHVAESSNSLLLDIKNLLVEQNNLLSKLINSTGSNVGKEVIKPRRKKRIESSFTDSHGVELAKPKQKCKAGSDLFTFFRRLYYRYVGGNYSVGSYGKNIKMLEHFAGKEGDDGIRQAKEFIALYFLLPRDEWSEANTTVGLADFFRQQTQDRLSAELPKYKADVQRVIDTL